MNSARFEEKQEYLITFCHSTRARALDAAAVPPWSLLPPPPPPLLLEMKSSNRRGGGARSSSSVMSVEWWWFYACLHRLLCTWDFLSCWEDDWKSCKTTQSRNRNLGLCPVGRQCSEATSLPTVYYCILRILKWTNNVSRLEFYWEFQNLS